MPNKQTNLNRALKKAEYVTSDMEQSPGGDHHDDMITIRSLTRPLDPDPISLKFCPPSTGTSEP
jgi:hypothetical protein